jgi:hypothetical protein
VDGEKIEVNFRLLKQIESEERIKVSPSRPIELHISTRINRLPVFLMVFGFVLLGLVAWQIWFDMTVWGKDIVLIFFGSRTGETISLGIGMKVIHYLLVGLIILLLGLITKRRSPRNRGYV